ncbi:hypothetical protein predicted by Glimmer/Critica [Bacteroides ovatus V975]|uniref:Uncharacterized protein n=1 Tax=Bacteroides ovatus (strain ATCC 8483 / DSM 1896 / JCM 5824 / BCRC 10623 / CCUG 4943 / NCTC 11153) TaxID=411476 RepID=A0AAN3AB45_BACO1|nr:hypothetical protein BACOVA_01065 [Bacteroides ovatus ATCC 8483]CAG9897735.1 hypothetical protein BOVA713_2829 [Bacteroides ovatus]CAG9909782.1 hypothetical protein BOVA435_828 [Bacteroides ovatus]CAG9916020.1 hypothetical protein BOVA172_3596 [Bacteroides ovatus]SCV06838.1 hypothetical protein predicted by Glimmer/Critica [Bacteroides ovatus V975]
MRDIGKGDSMPYRVLTNHLHKRKEKMKTNYILLFALMLMVS